MTLREAVKIQAVLDKRAIREDTLEFLDERRWSESKQDYIKYGDMHLDHFFRVHSYIQPLAKIIGEYYAKG